MEHPLGEESLEIDKTALYGIKRIPRLPSVDEVSSKRIFAAHIHA